MRRPEPRDVAFWAASIGGLIAYDVWADRRRPQGTLTNVLKWITRAETPTGRRLIETAVAEGERWLVPHLTQVAVDVAHALTEPMKESTP